MSAKMAKPLPECSGTCGRPVPWDVYLANGGMCSTDRHRADNVQLQLPGTSS